MTKLQELQSAKENILWLLENPAGSANMHGLAYWAGVVERLREEIKAEL